MNKIQEEDIQGFVSSFKLNDELKNSTFLITGATGLVGSCLIRCLLALNKNIHIIAPVRNKKKATCIFGDQVCCIELIECDLLHADFNFIPQVDYIVHCAAPTSRNFFVEKPVETSLSILVITTALLEYARKHTIKGFVYLSSLEVYGTMQTDAPITEDFQGYINPLHVRSSYPMSKRAAESLCCQYAAEYNLNACIARLTQTAGAGIANNDDRILAQFTRSAVQGKDIILHTTGESARPYCYTIDCVSALLYILLRGKAGEAYNVANESTYRSARELAEEAKNNINSTIQVRIELDENRGYAPITHLRLDTSKLQALGWTPHYDLKDILTRLSLSIKQ